MEHRLAFVLAWLFCCLGLFATTTTARDESHVVDASSPSSSSSLSRRSKRVAPSLSLGEEEEELEWLRERNAWNMLLTSSSGQAVLDSNETSTLEEFYDALGGNSGIGWKWNKDYELYGVPWNFTKTRDGSSYLQDPCHFRWQGIHCKCNVTHVVPDLEYYYDADNGQHDVYPCRIDKIFLQSSGGLPSFGLKGPFPQQAAAKLPHLTHLQLVNNDISGPLSSFCGLSANLTRLGLAFNRISSTIPLCLEKYTKLDLLGLYNNTLVGDLSALCQLSSKLKILNLGFNSLNGSLPSCLGRFTSLNILNSGYNRLVGPVTPICALPSTLNLLDLGSNALIGSIPSCIGGYSALTFLDFASNAFRPSPFPSFLAKLTNLKQLFLFENALTSSLPSFLASFKSLQVLGVRNNQLTGSIDVLCDLPKNIMNTINLESNKFSSTFPTCLHDFSALQFLLLGQNAIYGSLPPVRASHLPPLLEFTLNHNQLTGNVPVHFGNLSSLTQMLLNDNLFGSTRSSRPLPPQLDFINPLAQTSLFFVDISNNPFTGVLSTTFFSLPKLEYFAASVMCLDGGTLPEAICQATKLKYLLLSGLTSHPNCRRQLVPELGFLNNTLLGIVVNGSNPINKMSGTIPSCIFNLSMLSSFHATGGGFTGSIPPFTTAPLRQLAVSHNVMTGTVPPSIWQLKDLEYLDLAKNKFSGTCEALDANPSNLSQSSIYLNVNRFSGPFPRKLTYLKNLNVLRGNLFACPKHTGQLAMFYVDPALPRSDPYLDNYECGSCRFDAAMYVAIIVYGIILFVSAIFFYGSTRHEDTYTIGTWQRTLVNVCMRVGEWDAIARRSLNVRGVGCSIEYVFRFLYVLARLRRNVVYVLAFHVLVLLPIYISLSKSPNISILYDVSGWVTTASFLHGQTATIVLFVFWFLLLIGMSRLPIFHTLREEENPELEKKRENRAKAMNFYVRLTLLLRQTCILFISCFVLFFANVYYCVNKNGWIIAIAVLKLGWNSMVAPWALKTPLFHFGLTKQQIGDETFFAILLYTFNNFIIPVLSVFATSADCIFHMLNASQNIVSYVSFPAKTFSIRGVSVTIPALTQTTSYTPPFVYNYQCASNLLVNYTPVFVVMYILLALSYVIPDVVFRYILFPEATMEEEEALYELEQKAVEGEKQEGPQDERGGDDVEKEQQKQGENNGFKIKQPRTLRTWWRQLGLSSALPKMLLTPHERIELVQMRTPPLANNKEKSTLSKIALTCRSIFDTTMSIDDDGNVVLELLRPKIFLINQITNLLLLFTFGATSPLLSLVIVTAMILHTMRMSLAIGRFLQKEGESELRGKIKNRVGGAKLLNDECAQFSFRFLHNTRWLLVFLSSTFYAFFVLDTFGDIVGFQAALAPVVLLLCTPILVFLSERLLVLIRELFVFIRKLSRPPDDEEDATTTTTTTTTTKTRNYELPNVGEEQITNPLPEAAQRMSTSMSRMSKIDAIPVTSPTSSTESNASSSLQHRVVSIQPRSRKDSVRGANAATLIKLELNENNANSKN